MTNHLTLLTLQCHPATPCPLALQVSVALQWQANGLLLRYQVLGDVDGLLVPPPAVPGPAERLWQHTCLEAFVSPRQASHYREFNFSPSGQWAGYAFHGERQRDLAAEASQPIQPEMRWQSAPGQLLLWATLPGAALPRAPQMCLGLSAVLEPRRGPISYWALQHPHPDRPDFHHRAGWLDVERPPIL